MDELEEILGTDIDEGSTAGYGEGGGYSSPVVIDIPAIDEYNKRASQINKEIDQEWIDYKNFQPSNAKPYGYFDSGGQWQEARRSDSGVWMTPEGGFAMPTIYGGPEKPREYMKPISPLTGTESSTWNERKTVSRTRTPKNFALDNKVKDENVYVSLTTSETEKKNIKDVNTLPSDEVISRAASNADIDGPQAFGSDPENTSFQYKGLSVTPKQYAKAVINSIGIFVKELRGDAGFTKPGKQVGEGYQLDYAKDRERLTKVAQDLGINATSDRDYGSFFSYVDDFVKKTKNNIDVDAEGNYIYHPSKMPYNESVEANELRKGEFSVQAKVNVDGVEKWETYTFVTYTDKKRKYVGNTLDAKDVNPLDANALRAKIISTIANPESGINPNSVLVSDMVTKPTKNNLNTVFKNLTGIYRMAVANQNVVDKANREWTPTRRMDGEKLHVINLERYALDHLFINRMQGR